MHFEEAVKLDFDDVLIRPRRSEAPSRKTVELIRTFKSLHNGRELTCLPIVASNMWTTGTTKMANAFDKYKALVCYHKFSNILLPQPNAFVTVGIREEDLTGLPNEEKLPLICLDAANGYTMYFVKRLVELRGMYPHAIIMAGNVATPEMVQELLLMGADIVKIGIGPGSVCTTRIETGVGYPQLSAIIECANAAHGLRGLICADGGCKTPGDVAKAFAAGADFVMLGGMLAGCDECNDPHKFMGMASWEAQLKFYGKVSSYATPEGKCISVKPRGSAGLVLKRVTGGLRSTCAYVGATRLKDLSKCTTFVRVNRIH